MIYVENGPISAKQIGDLREAVGWNRMESCFESELRSSYFHIGAFDGEKLVGYLEVVSDGVTDAYIQNLIVHPEYQGKGIGTELMNRTIAYLKEKKIYMITVIFEENLLPYYKRFGFTPMLCGQLQTYETD